MGTDPESTTKKKKKSFKVHILPKNCKGCGICIHFCPTKVLAMDEARGIAKVVEESRCTGCLMCDTRCPDFAIQIERIVEKEEEP